MLMYHVVRTCVQVRDDEELGCRDTFSRRPLNSPDVVGGPAPEDEGCLGGDGEDDDEDYVPQRRGRRLGHCAEKSPDCGLRRVDIPISDLRKIWYALPYKKRSRARQTEILTTLTPVMLTTRRMCSQCCKASHSSGTPISAVL